MGREKIPAFLRVYHDTLYDLVNVGNLKEAKNYLYTLPTGVYDAIMERATRGYSFESLINKIESLDICKKTNDLYKLNNHDGDDNFIF